MKRTVHHKLPTNQDWLTTAEVAAEIGGISPYQVSAWCKNRLLPGSFKLPGVSGWRIPRKALDNFIAKRARG